MTFADDVGLPVSRSRFNGFRDHCVAYYYEVQVHSSHPNGAWSPTGGVTASEARDLPVLSVGFALASTAEARPDGELPPLSRFMLFMSTGAVDVVDHTGESPSQDAGEAPPQNSGLRRTVVAGGFSSDDVVGCGVEVGVQRRLFFTLNGRRVATIPGAGPTPAEFARGVYPVVELREPGFTVRANFGVAGAPMAYCEFAGARLYPLVLSTPAGEGLRDTNSDDPTTTDGDHSPEPLNDEALAEAGPPRDALHVCARHALHVLAVATALTYLIASKQQKARGADSPPASPETPEGLTTPLTLLMEPEASTTAGGFPPGASPTTTSQHPTVVPPSSAPCSLESSPSDESGDYCTRTQCLLDERAQRIIWLLQLRQASAHGSLYPAGSATAMLKAADAFQVDDVPPPFTKDQAVRALQGLSCGFADGVEEARPPLDATLLSYRAKVSHYLGLVAASYLPRSAGEREGEGEAAEAGESFVSFSGMGIYQVTLTRLASDSSTASYPGSSTRVRYRDVEDLLRQSDLALVVTMRRESVSRRLHACLALTAVAEQETREEAGTAGETPRSADLSSIGGFHHACDLYLKSAARPAVRLAAAQAIVLMLPSEHDPMVFSKDCSTIIAALQLLWHVTAVLDLLQQLQPRAATAEEGEADSDADVTQATAASRHEILRGLLHLVELLNLLQPSEAIREDYGSSAAYLHQSAGGVPKGPEVQRALVALTLRLSGSSNLRSHRGQQSPGGMAPPGSAVSARTGLSGSVSPFLVSRPTSYDAGHGYGASIGYNLSGGFGRREDFAVSMEDLMAADLEAQALLAHTVAILSQNPRNRQTLAQGAVIPLLNHWLQMYPVLLAKDDGRDRRQLREIVRFAASAVASLCAPPTAAAGKLGSGGGSHVSGGAEQQVGSIFTCGWINAQLLSERTLLHLLPLAAAGVDGKEETADSGLALELKAKVAASLKHLVMHPANRDSVADLGGIRALRAMLTSVSDNPELSGSELELGSDVLTALTYMLGFGLEGEGLGPPCSALALEAMLEMGVLEHALKLAGAKSAPVRRAAQAFLMALIHSDTVRRATLVEGSVHMLFMMLVQGAPLEYWVSNGQRDAKSRVPPLLDDPDPTNDPRELVRACQALAALASTCNGDLRGLMVDAGAINALTRILVVKSARVATPGLTALSCLLPLLTARALGSPTGTPAGYLVRELRVVVEPVIRLLNECREEDVQHAAVLCLQPLARVDALRAVIVEMALPRLLSLCLSSMQSNAGAASAEVLVNLGFEQGPKELEICGNDVTLLEEWFFMERFLQEQQEACQAISAVLELYWADVGLALGLGCGMGLTLGFGLGFEEQRRRALGYLLNRPQLALGFGLGLRKTGAGAEGSMQLLTRQWTQGLAGHTGVRAVVRGVSDHIRQLPVASRIHSLLSPQHSHDVASPGSLAHQGSGEAPPRTSRGSGTFTVAESPDRGAVLPPPASPVERRTSSEADLEDPVCFGLLQSPSATPTQSGGRRQRRVRPHSNPDFAPLVTMVRDPPRPTRTSSLSLDLPAELGEGRFLDDHGNMVFPGDVAHIQCLTFPSKLLRCLKFPLLPLGRNPDAKGLGSAPPDAPEPLWLPQPQMRCVIMPPRMYLSFDRPRRVLQRIVRKHQESLRKDLRSGSKLEALPKRFPFLPQVGWHLAFRDSSFEFDFISELMQALRQLPEIVSLSFGGDADSVPESLAHMVGSLPPNIQDITFDSCLSADSVAILLVVLKHCLSANGEGRRAGSFVSPTSPTSVVAAGEAPDPEPAPAPEPGPEPEPKSGVDDPGLAQGPRGIQGLGLRNHSHVGPETLEFLATVVGLGQYSRPRGPPWTPGVGLRWLDLSGNRMTDAVTASILTSLGECRSLTALDLGGTNLKGAADTAKALEDPGGILSPRSALARLHLDNMQCTKSGAFRMLQALLRGLGRSPADQRGWDEKEKERGSQERIRDPDPEERKGLPQTGLQALSLAQNSFADSHSAALRRILSSPASLHGGFGSGVARGAQPGLKEVDLRGTRLSVKMCTDLHLGVIDNKSLCFLFLDDAPAATGRLESINTYLLEHRKLYLEGLLLPRRPERRLGAGRAVSDGSALPSHVRTVDQMPPRPPGMPGHTHSDPFTNGLLSGIQEHKGDDGDVTPAGYDSLDDMPVAVPVLEESLSSSYGANSIAVFFSQPLAWWSKPRQAASPAATLIDERLRPMQLLDLDAERDTIWSAFREAKRDVRLIFDYATTEALVSKLAWHPRVLHFSGHGLEDHLTFEDGRAGVYAFDVTALQELIRRGDPGGKLKFVFVSACHSRRAGEAFVRAGVPHVICVNLDAALADTAARCFTRALYLSLATGTTVRQAFELARQAVKVSPEVRNATSEGDKFLLLPEISDAVPREHHDVAIFREAQRVPSWPPGSDAGGPLRSWRSSFPQLAHLPQPPEDYLGREMDMYMLLQKVLDRRFVTMLGQDGVGKSGVAAGLCHYMAERRFFPGGVAYVNLGHTAIANLSSPPASHGGLHNAAPPNVSAVLAAKVHKQICAMLRGTRRDTGPAQGDTHGRRARRRSFSPEESPVDSGGSDRDFGRGDPAERVFGHEELSDLRFFLCLDHVECFTTAPEALLELRLFIARLFESYRDVHILATCRTPGPPRPGDDAARPVAEETLNLSLGQVSDTRFLLAPLPLGATLRLFARQCPHFQTGRERFHFVRSMNRGDQQNLRWNSASLSPTSRAIFRMLGEGNPGLIRQVAFQCSEEKLERLLRLGTPAEIMALGGGENT